MTLPASNTWTQAGSCLETRKAQSSQLQLYFEDYVPNIQRTSLLPGHIDSSREAIACSTIGVPDCYVSLSTCRQSRFNLFSANETAHSATSFGLNAPDGLSSAQTVPFLFRKRTRQNLFLETACLTCLWFPVSLVEDAARKQCFGTFIGASMQLSVGFTFATALHRQTNMSDLLWSVSSLPGAMTLTDFPSMPNTWFIYERFLFRALST